MTIQSQVKRIACVTAAILSAAFDATAYQVWMGTHLSTSETANDLSSWSKTASQLEGFNVNRAPHDTDPASNAEYRTIFSQFTNAGNTMTEFARSQATRDPAKFDELAFPSIAQRLEEIFSIENNFGYELSIIMFYDERGTFQGTEYLYEWTEPEIQYLRDWLDTNGHADIELMWNVRNNSVRNRDLAANPLVDSVEIEASTTALLNNTNNQITFFEWFWDNPVTSGKRIALQIPRTLDSLNQFKGTRRVAQMLGGIIGYDEDGMRSDRLIFLPVTYNDNYDYIPETTNDGTTYTNSLTSICLSLIEQRDLFEGRLESLPSVADADSVQRTVPPTISDIANQVAPPNLTSAAIPFTLSDEDTPLNTLSLTATSSNPAVVPPGGISFGGTGANRNLTITPNIGQTGTTEVTVQVSDGLWNDSTTFRIIVGERLLSSNSDASVRDNMVAIEQSNTTTLLGTGGVTPFVDRCTIYVFQLPDLGAVVAPFTGAFFSFNAEAKQGTLKGNDLYGLGRRASATVLGSDYYGQSSTSDPTDATRLQTNILTDGTPLGIIETSSAGNEALATYLNQQYAAGAGIGEYVFLRLNTTEPKTGIDRATLTMSEGSTRPQIVYTGESTPPDPLAPIAHWPFDEAAGTTTADATGNGYTGTLSNGPTWGSDANRDSYISFDGINDRISTPFTYALSSSDDFTWAWWARAHAATHSGSIMVGNRYPQPGSSGDTFEFIKLTPTHGQFAATSEITEIERYDYGAITNGAWRHYAMVKSGTSYQWYVDGLVQGAPVTLNYDQNAPIPFFIGGDDNGTDRVNEHFEGDIDDVVLYRRALNSTEVVNLGAGIYSVPPIIGEMPGLENDADVRDDGVRVNIRADNLVPGRSGSNGGFDRSTVFVFELPNLGQITDPFTGATLGFDVYDTSATPPTVDLYGLGKRSSPDVLVSDYHGNSVSRDTTDATLIQTNLLTENSGTGFQTSGSSTALAAYLNTQYDHGGGIGSYVFLRLSTNTTNSGLHRHFITSADGASDDNRPRITYTATPTNDDDFDSWLSQFNFAPGVDLTPDGDPDSDGLNTWLEYLFGLDPSDATSRQPITTLLSPDSGTFVYTRRNPALSGVTNYQIWISEDLANWYLDTTATQITGDGGELQSVAVTLTDPIGSLQKFVRIIATP